MFIAQSCLFKLFLKITNIVYSGELVFPESFIDESHYYLFRLARVGIFPRSSLLGAGRWGSGNLGRVGQLGEGEQMGSVYKQPEREVDDSYHNWRGQVSGRGHKGEAKGN